MKILLINDYLKFYGGAEKTIFDLRNILESKGHLVEILGSNKNDEDILSWFSRWLSLSYFLETKKTISRFKPDIVHCHNLSRIISPSPVLACKMLKVPIVMTVHDYHLVCPKTWMIYKNGQPCKYGLSYRCLISNCKTFEEGIWKFPYQWLKIIKILLHRFIIFNNVNYFICPSRPLYNWIEKNVGRSNVGYVPNFIEENIPQPLSGLNAKKNNQFLFIGRLGKEKGCEVLIKAIKIVKNKHPEVLLKIVGDGPERQNLENQTCRYKLTKNIQFLGKIPNPELHPLYRESSSLVIPSVWMENCPIVGIEALMNKCAIIGSNRGGILDMVEDGKNGFIFTSGNEKELAKNIIKLLDNRSLCLKMGLCGYQKFINIFSKDTYYKKIIKIYKKCLKK